MNNIFFTGLSGFLGQEFLKYYNGRKDNNFRFIQNPVHYRGNGKDYNYAFSADDFPENIDILVHAGAFSPKTREQMEDSALNIANITNTDYLLKNLPNIPQKIIYISTISVYSPSPAIISEETALGGDSVYGISKLMCEKIIQNYCAANKTECQILRLGVIYGNNPKVKGLIPTFIEKICRNENIVIYNNGVQKKNFINIHDVSRIIYKAITEDIVYPVVNITGETAISVREVAEMLLKYSGKDIKIDSIDTNNTMYDMDFDTSKMIKAFGRNETGYAEGLKSSYNDMSEVYNEGM